MNSTGVNNYNMRKSARPGRISYVELSAEDQQIPFAPRTRKAHKGWKIAGCVASLAVVSAVTAYGGEAYYYSNRFFEGTTINGVDVSGKNAYEAEMAIASKVADYEISVSSRNAETETIRGTDINYEYASTGDVLKLLKSQNPLAWINGYVRKTSYTVETKATYDKTLLEEQVRELACAQEENQVEAENAYISYNGSSFEIIPETEGSELMVRQAYRAVDEAITSDSTSIDLSSEPNVYAEAEVTSDSEELQATLEAYNNLANATITYTFGDTTEVLDGSTISTWLAFDEKGQLQQNDATFQEKVTEYVAELAAKYDTVGTEREFTASDGRLVYVSGGTYGWQIDQAAEAAQLIQDIQNGGSTSREPIYALTANSRGVNDFGDTYIEVDMGSQHMFYYQNGSIIFDSDFVSGMISDPSRATPSGVYTMYYKSSPAVLKGADYETPVSYWMPFNGGVGFHDASWQPYFGGDRFTYGGSHGCINLPVSAAATLYSIIETGVPIICFY